MPINLSPEQTQQAHGEGSNTQNPTISRFLELTKAAHESQFGPKITFVEIDKVKDIDDQREFTENQITDLICKEWDETPDTLVPTQLARLDNSAGLILTETFESTNPPAGLEKVAYQFARKADFVDDAFYQTEICRFEFAPIIGGQETHLGDNQMLDTESNCIVTYHQMLLT